MDDTVEILEKLPVEFQNFLYAKKMYDEFRNEVVDTGGKETVIVGPPIREEAFRPLFRTYLRVSVPKSINAVRPPGYYPYITRLNPEQRWIYYQWRLGNLSDREINIDYAFTYLREIKKCIDRGVVRWLDTSFLG